MEQGGGGGVEVCCHVRLRSSPPASCAGNTCLFSIHRVNLRSVSTLGAAGVSSKLPWTKISEFVGTRSAQQCMSKWYNGFGDKVLGIQYDDNDDLALVSSIWDQDPGDMNGAPHGTAVVASLTPAG
jgi:hypothetical protein